MSAAAQMLSGGVQLLALAVVAGEFSHFRARDISSGAWLSLIYLIIAGSIISYTAYVWLLHYESPTRVGTYAYVNPVVAVILGYAVFAGSAVLLFHAANRDPHSPQKFGFVVFAPPPAPRCA